MKTAATAHPIFLSCMLYVGARIKASSSPHCFPGSSIQEGRGSQYTLRRDSHTSRHLLLHQSGSAIALPGITSNTGMNGLLDTSQVAAAVSSQTPSLAPACSPKVAFLFLCEDGIQTEPLWRAWFEARPHWRSVASVYVHARPGVRMAPNSFFKGHEIRTRTRVQWGTASMVVAETELLRAALRSECNAHFVLLSDSCAPLWPLSCTLGFLSRARSHSFVSGARAAQRRSQYACLPSTMRTPWRKGSQWVVLSRPHARMVSREAELQRWLRACPGKLPFLDEHYVQQVIGFSNRSSRSIFPVSLTYAEFGDHSKVVRYHGATHAASWHARTFDSAQLRALLVRTFRPLFGTCSFQSQSPSSPSASRNEAEAKRRFCAKDGHPIAMTDEFSACAMHVRRDNATISGARKLSGPCYLFVRKVHNESIDEFSRLVRQLRPKCVSLSDEGSDSQR